MLDGGSSARETLYTRGETWGEFETAQSLLPSARLLVYGRHGLVETVPLDLQPGRQCVLR